MTPNDLSWRTQNIGRVLFSASYVFAQDKLRTVNARAPAPLTAAQLALFETLDLQAASLTQLAQKASMTKQAMLELVDRAERLKLLRRRADPADRRSKFVEPTARGAEILARLAESVTEAEGRLAVAVGADFLARLKVELGRYVANVGGEGPLAAANESWDPLARWREQDIGHVMRAATDVFVAETTRLGEQAGYAMVRDVQLPLFRNMDLSGARLTVIAQRAQMTKQAMRELVDRSEAMGWVERSPDPDDGRAKLIRFTDAGLELLRQVGAGLIQAEAAMEQIAGNAFLADAKHRLTAYVAAWDTQHMTGVDLGS